jgi:hypothetical protein
MADSTMRCRSRFARAELGDRSIEPRARDADAMKKSANCADVALARRSS